MSVLKIKDANSNWVSVPTIDPTPAVEAWLDENVDPATGYVLDSSLTMDNAAAPADKVGELKSAIIYKDNLSNRWANVGLTSSNGNLAPATTPRSTLMVYVPKDVVSFSCESVNSCVSAFSDSEYIGVWNGVDGFAKSFTNVNFVDFQTLIENYPNYNYRITVYCYPADIDQYITILRTGRDRIKTNSKINTLGKYIESYYKIAQGIGTNLVFASEKGLFAEELMADGVDAIQCSELVYAALCKIPYENSRYNGLSENVYSGPFWMTDGSVSGLDYMPTPYIYPDYLRADQLAKYFDGKGQLIPFDPNHNNLQPGDLVFVGSSAENYRGITHVCVALGYDDKNNVIITVESSAGTKPDGSPAGVNFVNRSLANNNVYYAKVDIVTENGLSYKISEGHTLSSSINANSSKTVSANRNLIYDLPSGFYTVIIDSQPTPSAVFMAQVMAYPGAERTNAVSIVARGKKVNSKQIINIAIPSTAYNLNSILINANNTSAETIELPSLHYRVYTGWLDTDPEP